MRLPQLSGRIFLTDGGMETTLIFHEGIDLPYFASFDLLKNAEGDRAHCAPITSATSQMAKKAGTGFVLESPTWRANPDWGAKLGYDRSRSRGDEPPLDRADGRAARRRTRRAARRW